MTFIYPSGWDGDTPPSPVTALLGPRRVGARSLPAPFPRGEGGVKGAALGEVYLEAGSGVEDWTGNGNNLFCCCKGERVL